MTDKARVKRTLLTCLFIGLAEAPIYGWLIHNDHRIAALIFSAASTAFLFAVVDPRWDWALVIGRGGDERQRAIGDRSARSAFFVMLAVSLGGAGLEMSYGGDPGPFALIGGLGITAYLICVAALLRR